MMEDIGKDKFVNDFITQVQKITAFIYGHNRILNMMRANATNGRDLIRPYPTRFASNFITLESLLKYRHELIGYFNSRELLKYCNKSLKDESFITSMQVGHLVGDKNFWDRILYYLSWWNPSYKCLEWLTGMTKVT